MPVLGNRSSSVGMVLHLLPTGPTPVIVGQGICLIVGMSDRGPANEAVGMTSPTMADALFYAGDVKEAIETVFAQGCTVVYGARVLGVGNEKASVDLEDDVQVPNNIGKLEGASEGAWGNSGTAKIENATYRGTDKETFNGDGTVGPYALKVWDLVEASTNSVKVNAVAKTIVYDVGDIGAGKVFMDKTEGEITFYTDEEPEATDQVTVLAKYETIKITLSDGTTSETYHNIRDLIGFEAELADSGIARFVPAEGETHLPKAGSYTLVGGSDGIAVTVDDWETLLNKAVQYVTPQTVILTSNEVTEGTYDLVGVLDAWTIEQAAKYKPVLGFIGADANETIGDLLDLVGGFNNLHMCIVANPWDERSTPRQNLAAARAGKEAAVSLGESAAMPINSINGANGLLNEFSDPERDVLDQSRIDVLIKQRGIKPYRGITTASDSPFQRCVDMRTVHWCIRMIKFVTDEWYHRKNTLANRSAIKASIDAELENLVFRSVLYAYDTLIWPHATNPNKVFIRLGIQPIGHIERFEVTMLVGVIEEIV